MDLLYAPPHSLSPLGLRSIKQPSASTDAVGRHSVIMHKTAAVPQATTALGITIISKFAMTCDYPPKKERCAEKLALI